MDGKHPSFLARRFFLRHPRSYFAYHLAGCFLAVFLATSLVAYWTRTSAGVSMIWLADGVLLAFLLYVPRKLWPAYLLTGFLALTAGTILLRGIQPFDFLWDMLDVVDAGVAAVLLRRRSAQLPRFTDTNYVLRFVAYAAFVSPIFSSSLLFCLLKLLHRPQALSISVQATFAEMLGVMVTTPSLVAILRSRRDFWKDVRIGWVYILLLAAVTVTAFLQQVVPVHFFIYPLLILIGLRQSLTVTSTVTLFLAVVGCAFTLRGYGPFVLLATIYRLHAEILLQIYIISIIVVQYGIHLARAQQKASERALEDIVHLHDMVTENSMDVICLGDFSGHFLYISQAIESVSGWSPQEICQRNFMDFIFAEDQEKAIQATRNLRAGSPGERFELRVRNKAGEYFWMECNQRMVRDPRTGVATGTMNILRDISERKRAEEQLKEAYLALEVLSLTDALTGLPNRRHFDQFLSMAWRHAIRERRAISMLMIDVDYFKLFNDTYGHTRGDQCLQQVAHSIREAVVRSTDLAARFGGEEFAVILPYTGQEGVVQIAKSISNRLSRENIPFPQSPYARLTISMGCSTLNPDQTMSMSELIEQADSALYDAKRSGRNQIFAPGDGVDAPQRIILDHLECGQIAPL